MNRVLSLQGMTGSSIDTHYADESTQSNHCSSASGFCSTQSNNCNTNRLMVSW